MARGSALRTIASTGSPLPPTVEDTMQTRFDIDREGAVKANSVRAFVATLCVLGLASFMWLHSGTMGELSDNAAAVPPAAANAADEPRNDYLHAPTSDPSLPSLEATFAHKDAGPSGEPAAPTF
jgi:hypothetical protein